MLDHDQNPVESEMEIEGNDTASKSTEVEAVLENNEEPKMEERTSEIEVDEEPEAAKAEIQEEAAVKEPQEETAIETEDEAISPEPTAEVEEEKPALEAQEEPKAVEPEVELTPEELEHKNMLNMYEESFSNFKVGEIIDGTIVDISDKEVRVDIGFKSEGVI